MAQYTLHVEDEGFSNTLNFEADHLDDILMYLKMFVQGSGFTWVDGELQFVVDEPVPFHNAHYFDTERNK